MSTRRLLLSPLLLLVALATVLGAGTVSASAAHGPETRVRAFDTVAVDGVGQPSSETAGHVGCLRPSQPGLVSGSCVATEAAAPRETLFHYTDEAGQNGILDSGQLNPSLKSVNPADARYGNGQYLSDVQPGSMSCAQLSRCFLGQPFQGSRFTNYVEIDVTGLDIIKGRPGVFVNPSETPLDLTGRIVSWGRN